MKNEKLLHIAQSLAAELSAADFPNLWRVSKRRGEWYQELMTGNAWINIQENKGRLTIASDRPREMKTAGNAERITVDASRKPEAIARDICARLLPNAREYFQNCRDYSRKDKADRARHAEILASLQPFRRWSNTESDGRRTSFYSQRAKLDIYATKVYSLNIDSPTMEEVQTILQLLERTPKENDYDTE